MFIPTLLPFSQRRAGISVYHWPLRAPRATHPTAAHHASACAGPVWTVVGARCVERRAATLLRCADVIHTTPVFRRIPSNGATCAAGDAATARRDVSNGWNRRSLHHHAPAAQRTWWCYRPAYTNAAVRWTEPCATRIIFLPPVAANYTPTIPHRLERLFGRGGRTTRNGRPPYIPYATATHTYATAGRHASPRMRLRRALSYALSFLDAPSAHCTAHAHHAHCATYRRATLGV